MWRRLANARTGAAAPALHSSGESQEVTPAIRVRRLEKWYPSPAGGRVHALHVEVFELARRERIAVTGPSGSGKSTLLHVIAGIVPASSGEVAVLGTPIHSATEAERDALRGRSIGIVFQSFHLLATFSARENVLLPMVMARSGGSRRDREARADMLLDRLGLGDRLHHRPAQLSAGQRQRVAIARALANRPELVLADEPTAHVEASMAVEALDLLEEVCAEEGAALVVATHDPIAIARFARVFALSRPAPHVRRHPHPHPDPRRGSTRD
jgi:putative ABC transport system ATP-binding protein